ncbi:ATP-binding protein [Priestia flexa]|uniref:AAA family ATPase n=1 Tax=Priestia flexa TaxID=86664 RepID=A0ABU4J7G1_9BACI|nr:ATP-binding protein [Priestia flexa]MDW8516915.1 AAA family ATPase [Priestia flexa]
MENKLGELIMLVGLPGSGKSTLAEKLRATKKYVHLSSDNIRQELTGDVNNQDENSRIFEVMNERATELLKSGQHVIYDATNVHRKRRKHLITQVFKANKKTVYYLNEHIDEVKSRNQQRARVVKEESINRMYKSAHIPVENEGWDEVTYISTKKRHSIEHKEACEKLFTKHLPHDELFSELSCYIPDFSAIIDLPQDSKYHSFSVSRHTYYVYLHIQEHYQDPNKLVLLWAALFHDLGKGTCKSFVNYKGEETKYASFIGHDYVSSQLAAYWLTILGYEGEFVKRVSALTQFHMYPMNAGDKKLRELKELLGDELFSELIILHEADLQAK